MRECGILLPVASLPSRYGIGAFSREAFQFVDQLKEAGQQYWQILPLGPTGYGDLPTRHFPPLRGTLFYRFGAVDKRGASHRGGVQGC